MFRLKQTCADCRDNDFDKTVDCPGTGCAGQCIECYRMADGCSCTCKDIAFTCCPTYTSIENCACSDGTQETHDILTGAWFGFVIDDDLKAKFLAIALAECPDNPHYELELYGSTYDFGSHTTTTNLNCPRDISGWVPIAVPELVTDFQGGALVRGDASACIGGAFFLSLDTLGIILNPRPMGAADGTVSCSQEGGCVAFLMRIKTACSTLQQIVLCPFNGVAGADFKCDFVGECEDWSEEFPQISGCQLDFTFTHIAGTCTLTETITFGSEAPFVIDPAMGSIQHFSKTVPGCTGDGLTPYVVRVQKVWDAGCVHNCSAHNSDVSTTYTV